MENLSDSQWRFTDSNSDNLDESITETINSSFLSCNTQKDSTDYGLLNAMSNLQITQAKEAEQLHYSNVATNSSIDEDNKLLDENKDCDQENTFVENSKTNSPLDSFFSSKVLKTIKKAVTPLNSQSVIKSTKAASPSLLEAPKSRILNTSLNRSRTKNENSKETDKRVIKTIIDTDEGIQLREERIIHFSIPIIATQKKRTEAVPFSFSTRTNNKSTTKINNNDVLKKQKTGTANNIKNVPVNSQRNSIIRSHSTSVISKNQRVSKGSEVAPKIKSNSGIFNRSTTTSSLSTMKNTKNFKTNFDTSNNKKLNQENKTPNINESNKPKTKSQLVGIVPPKLYTDKRAKKRQEFDIMLKQKEVEIEKMRIELEKKQREKEKLEELVLRKATEHKANPMPEFKVPAPIRSKKPLTQPQSPAWALKAKQIK